MNKSQARPVIFGEVLFDRFPDGGGVPGGAPFNVAWSLAALGYDPLFISRVGNDADGRALLNAMQRWGMPLDGMQVDPTHPTGEVRVTPGNGGSTYEIAHPAWDFIDREQTLAAVGSGRPPLIYHGTLALRSPTSRDSLNLLRNTHRTVTFVDLNLRAPWWNPTGAERGVVGANHVKLNDEELARLTGRPCGTAEETADAAQRWFDEWGFETLVVTRGAAGALAVDGRGVHHAPPPPTPAAIVDTVGAGDAFAAVMIAGILSGWDIRRSVARAGAFASAVVGLSGATTGDRAFYEPFRREWHAE
ncbi:MAG: carbohydrate kinase [Nitrospinae bacterium]|nr:carbohydrate kinase [Nitrospinota bacterium]